MALLGLVVSNDNYVGANLSRIVTEEGIRNIRSADLDRLTRELKKPGRLAVIDVAWEAVQERGVLKQLVNIARITGNKVICICPNQDEDLKKLAALARADKVFIRYDLEITFRQFLKDVQIEAAEEK